ncbi:MAG: DUF547 domain-containing protein [bacterium]|nr:DUF547 domain-containing protein [bacterium]
MRKCLLATLLLCSSAFAFDHSHAQFQTVLNKYVKDGRVNYSVLVNDRTELDAYVTSIGEVSFEQYRAFTKSEKLALMINLYNAAAMQFILNHWPVESIQDVGGLFSSPWNMKFVNLFGREASLGMIEHDILRADFKEPRIHFALVCASLGCPTLRPDVYVDTKLNQQLAEQERAFMTQRPKENRFENGVLYISPIFKWYKEDFDDNEGVRTLFQIYYPEVKIDTRIEYTEYDWSLNRQ